jgi:hypothetical protein
MRLKSYKKRIEKLNKHLELKKDSEDKLKLFVGGRKSFRDNLSNTLKLKKTTADSLKDKIELTTVKISKSVKSIKHHSDRVKEIRNELSNLGNKHYRG